MFANNSILIEAIKFHAAKEQPKESCGLIITQNDSNEYVPCRNIAKTSLEHFIIHHKDFAAAEDGGEISAIVHSHPFISAKPSMADLVMCEKTQLPWLIVNHPVGTIFEFSPSGYEAPLLGRPFVHGILDCYTLIQDCFRLEKGIDLPDFERREDWWEPKEGEAKGDDLYMKHYSSAGFVEIDKANLRPYDCLIMRLKEKHDPSHAAIYLGGNVMLHHMVGRLSRRETYGGWYIACTVFALRHKQLL